MAIQLQKERFIGKNSKVISNENPNSTEIHYCFETHFSELLQFISSRQLRRIETSIEIPPHLLLQNIFEWNQFKLSVFFLVELRNFISFQTHFIDMRLPIRFTLVNFTFWIFNSTFVVLFQFSFTVLVLYRSDSII